MLKFMVHQEGELKGNMKMPYLALMVHTVNAVLGGAIIIFG